jgi:hypothetical protein
MKTALILVFLMLAGISYAQPDPEECFRDCCLRYEGEWNEDNGVCVMEYNSSSYSAHSECQEECIEDAFGEAGVPFCCPGAMVLAVLAGFALTKR